MILFLLKAISVWCANPNPSPSPTLNQGYGMP